MARRTRHRASGAARKRPATAPRPSPGTEAAAPESDATPVAGTPPQAEAALAPQAAPPAHPAGTASLLPRRRPAAETQPKVVEPVPEEPAPVTSAAAQPTPPTVAAPAAQESLLPRRGRVAGRAERRRQQEAALEPLGEDPAVPLDRTPYLILDLRRVALVSGLLAVLVVLGYFFLH